MKLVETGKHWQFGWNLVVPVKVVVVRDTKSDRGSSGWAKAGLRCLVVAYYKKELLLWSEENIGSFCDDIPGHPPGYCCYTTESNLIWHSPCPMEHVQ